MPPPSSLRHSSPEMFSPASPARARGVPLLTGLLVLLLSCNPSGSAKEKLNRKILMQAPSIEPHENGLLFLGDSITEGYRLPPEQSIPSRIQKMLEKRKLPLVSINGGLSGDTSLGGLHRLDLYLNDRFRPSILVIELGFNDAFQSSPLEPLRENLKSIIIRAREYDPRMKILLVQLALPEGFAPPYRREFYRVFQTVAEEMKVPLLPDPMEGMGKQHNLLQEDGLHPNGKGAELIARRLWESLENHLP